MVKADKWLALNRLAFPSYPEREERLVAIVATVPQPVAVVLSDSLIGLGERLLAFAEAIPGFYGDE